LSVLRHTEAKYYWVYFCTDGQYCFEILITYTDEFISLISLFRISLTLLKLEMLLKIFSIELLPLSRITQNY